MQKGWLQFFSFFFLQPGHEGRERPFDPTSKLKYSLRQSKGEDFRLAFGMWRGLKPEAGAAASGVGGRGIQECGYGTNDRRLSWRGVKIRWNDTASKSGEG